jgi:hypothetical protein
MHLFVDYSSTGWVIFGPFLPTFFFLATDKRKKTLKERNPMNTYIASVTLAPSLKQIYL